MWAGRLPARCRAASPHADPICRARPDPVRACERAADRKQAGPDRGRAPVLPPSIPPGMRALAVRVNDVIGVAGFTVPGTRVDVLVTTNRGEASMSRAVVSNVQVLTAGTALRPGGSKDGKAIPTAVVTLMLTPDDAERITLAQHARGPSRSRCVTRSMSFRPRRAACGWRV